MEESFGRYLALCRHERVGHHAFEHAPAWVFSDDGRRLLWANAAGLAFLDIRSLSGLSRYRISETSPVSRRLAYLATRGTTSALERFRFFVGLRAKPVACLCERLSLPDNDKPVLAVAADAPAMSGEDPAIAGFLRMLDQAGLAAALFDHNGDLFQTTSALAASGLPADVLARRSDLDGIDLVSGPGADGSLVLVEDPTAIDLEPGPETTDTAVDESADHAEADPVAETEPDDATGGAPDEAAGGDNGAVSETPRFETEEAIGTSDITEEEDQVEDQPAEASTGVDGPSADDGLKAEATDAAAETDAPSAGSDAEPDTKGAPVEEDAEPLPAPPTRALDARSATAFAAVGAALAAETASTPPPSDKAVKAEDDTEVEPDQPAAEMASDMAEVEAEQDLTETSVGTDVDTDPSSERPDGEPVEMQHALETDANADGDAGDDAGAPDPDDVETGPEDTEAPVVDSSQIADASNEDAAQADTTDRDAAPGRKRTVFDAIERLAVPLMNLDLAKAPSRLAPKDDEPEEPDVEPENGTVPEPPVETGSAVSPAFVFRSRTAPHRFVWEMDEDRRFSMITPDLADAVGPISGNVTGKTWTEVADALGLDNPRIAATIERGETWTGMRVEWPVDGTDKIIPVELTALPIYDQSRTFAGYRGFGVCRTDRAQSDPQARGLLLAQPLTAPETDDADAIETTFSPSDEPEEGPDSAANGMSPDPAPFVTPVLSEPGAADTPPESEADPDPDADDEIAAAPEAEAEEAQADLSWRAYLTAEALLRLFSETRTDDAERARFAALARIAGPDDDTPGPGRDDRPDGDPGGGSEDGPDRAPDAPASEAEQGRETTDSDGTPEDSTDPLTRTAETDEETEAEAEANTASADEPDADSRATPHDASNVVPLVRSDSREPNDKIQELSRPEREAFLQIAEALGARLEGEDEDPVSGSDKPAGPTIEVVEPDAPVVALPSAFAIGRRDVPEGILLDRLPIGVLLCRGAEVLFGNRAALDVLEYRSVADLRAAGGLEAVFTDGAATSSGDPSDEADRPISVRTRTGQSKSLVARLYSVPWANDRALMIVLDESAPAAPPANTTVLPQDSRVAELESILDTATDGVLVMENDGTIRAANKSAEALFGADRVDMLGANLTDYLAPESHRSALDYIDGLARNGVESVLNDGREVIGRTTTGGLIPMFMTIGRIDRGEHSAKFCAVLRDITQWKKAEEDLTSARRQAETASSQKSDFLAKISHELRTPLNAIIGFSEVMLGERLGPIGTERYKEYLSDIRASGDYIMSLINDLLDLSKIEAGKMDLTFEAVAVNDVLHNCVALLQPEANRERIIIRTSLSTAVPNVVADARSLQQIVLNLLSNAIKFNKKGGQVIVSSAYTETGDVSVRVRDTGTGMSDEDVRLALEPFRQVQTSRPHSGGTGLGLPLTKALVEANRASFSIDSTPQEGTMVEITFPSPRVLAE